MAAIRSQQGTYAVECRGCTTQNTRNVCLTRCTLLLLQLLPAVLACLQVRPAPACPGCTHHSLRPLANSACNIAADNKKNTCETLSLSCNMSCCSCLGAHDYSTVEPVEQHSGSIIQCTGVVRCRQNSAAEQALLSNKCRNLPARLRQRMRPSG